jgi:ribosomal protein S2
MGNMNQYTEKDFLNILLNNQVHIYSSTLRDKKLLPFIMGTRKGFKVLDLSKTLSLLKKVLFLVEEYVSNKGKILFICDFKLSTIELRNLKKNFIVLENNWPEGSLTNFANTRHKSIYNQHQIKNQLDSQSFNTKLGRKKQSQIKKFFKKFQILGFLTTYPRFAVYVTHNPSTLVLNELSSLNIPTAVLSDNLKFSDKVDYPILCNIKDSLFCKLFINLLINFAKRGQNRFVLKHHYKGLANINKKKLIRLLNINYGK